MPGWRRSSPRAVCTLFVSQELRGFWLPVLLPVPTLEITLSLELFCRWQTLNFF